MYIFFNLYVPIFTLNSTKLRIKVISIKYIKLNIVNGGGIIYINNLRN